MSVLRPSARTLTSRVAPRPPALERRTRASFRRVGVAPETPAASRWRLPVSGKQPGTTRPERRTRRLNGTTNLPGMGEVPARFPVDMRIAELAQHAWDLTRATGQAIELAPEVGKHSLSWLRTALNPQFRGAESDGKAFGPEVPIPEDAPIYDRLAAFSGRDPKLC